MSNATSSVITTRNNNNNDFENSISSNQNGPSPGPAQNSRSCFASYAPKKNFLMKLRKEEEELQNSDKTDSEVEDDKDKITETEGKKLSFKCEECGKAFKHKSYFDYHMRTHTGERPHKCHLCEKSFFEKSKLNRHLSSCHQIRNSSYLSSTSPEDDKSSRTCSQCNKVFSRVSGLQTHLLTHAKIRPFACSHPDCDQKFSGLTALKNHEKIHENSKNEMCDLCGKKFLLKKYLDLHVKTTHKMGVRQFKCSKCWKEFHSAKDLRRHGLMHSDDKSFTCNLCKARFKRKDNYNRHLKLTHLLTPEQIGAELESTLSDDDDDIITEHPEEMALESSINSLESIPPQPQPPPPPPPPPVSSRQVSVIRSTQEFIMSFSRGEAQF